MRIGFYDPYLSTLGGGEKYLLTLLEIGLQLSSDVVLLSPAEPEVDNWQRLRIDVERDRFVWRQTDDSTLTAHSTDLDLLVAVHNYFPPRSAAKRSVLILQFPFWNALMPPLRHRSLDVLRRWREERQGLYSYDVVLAYSKFVQRHIAIRTGRRSVVLPPPVDPPADLELPKEDRILAVGRFFRGDANKKQDALIDSFLSLKDSQPAARGWSLCVAGGVSTVPDHDGDAFVAELQARAAGAPVEFFINPSAADLASLYARSRLFWHATGLDEPRARHPERMEHFGITTVEAMSYRCVPVVFAAGGQKEIVADGRTGCLWSSRAELVSKTAGLMERPSLCDEMGARARRSARGYEKMRFVTNATALLNRVAGS